MKNIITFLCVTGILSTSLNLHAFEMTNDSDKTLWVNIGAQPATSKEGILNPFGYKVIKPGDSASISKITYLKSFTGLLWVRAENSSVAKGFELPVFKSVDEVEITEDRVYAKGKRLSGLAILGSGEMKTYFETIKPKEEVNLDDAAKAGSAPQRSE